METKPARKKLIMISCSIAATVIALGVVIFLTVLRNKDRKITLLELTGTVQVERGGSTLTAEKGMKLKTGDILVSGEGSSARIRIDDDKFLYIDGSSRVSIQADGTAKESHTVVFVEKGALLTEVKRKLSEQSTFLIVTPNTSMSIHGTKTLTEVYEDILGAIKTNAAVVEGQVSFKTVSKDATGKRVVTSIDLRAGQGVGISTDSKDLLSAEDVKHISDDGQAPVDLLGTQSVNESGCTMETPLFSEEFLTNVVAVLARSREEDIEEGFATEDVTEEELNAAINTLNDVIDGKTELPPAVEAYLLNQAQPSYNETIISDTPDSGGKPDNTPKVENAEDSVPGGQEDNSSKENDDAVIQIDGEDGLIDIGDEADDEDKPEGNGFASNREDLVAEEERKSTADTGSNGGPASNAGTGTDVGTGTGNGTDAGNVGGGSGTTSGEEEPEVIRDQPSDAGANAETETMQQGSADVQADIVSKADVTMDPCTQGNHDLEDHVAKAPTCTEAGWEAYQTCKNCEYTTYTKIEATGHSYGEWETTVEPGPVYEEGYMIDWHVGTKVRTCANCAATEEAVILVTPALRCELFSGAVTSLPVDIFTASFYAEGMSANATLNDFDILFFVSSPIIEGDFVNLDAGIQWVNGSTPVSSLQEGDTVQVSITVPADKKDVYTDTVVTILLTGPAFAEEIGVTE